MLTTATCSVSTDQGVLDCTIVSTSCAYDHNQSAGRTNCLLANGPCVADLKSLAFLIVVDMCDVPQYSQGRQLPSCVILWWAIAGDGHAYSALGQTAAELQKWPVAAAAYQRSAELCAAAGDQDEQATELVLAGKHWLNAVAEARHMRKTAAATASRSSSTQVRGSAMAADVPADLQAISSTSAVHDDRQQVGQHGMQPSGHV